MTDDKHSYQLRRMNLWSAVAIAVAGTDNVVNRRVPSDWADSVLEKFDEKFAEESQIPSSVKRSVVAM